MATVIAQVDANSTASWEEIQKGLFKSYVEKSKVYQGVVDGDWFLKPMIDTAKATAQKKQRHPTHSAQRGAGPC